jgi:threonine/homoserine/homoserine lactone efflux protein
MDTALLLTFLIVSVALIVVPGPNVLVIVSTSVTHGRVRGLQTVAGTTLAMFIQLVIAALATTGIVHLLADGLYVLKWAGVAYLSYLGVQHLRRACTECDASLALTGASSFFRGFMVSLTNPKTIIFFAAFLPQFVSYPGDYVRQLALLSAVFLVLAALLDSCYAVLAAGLKSYLERRQLRRFQHGLGAILYLGASAWLAGMRRLQ